MTHTIANNVQILEFTKAGRKTKSAIFRIGKTLDYMMANIKCKGQVLVSMIARHDGPELIVLYGQVMVSTMARH